MEVNGMRPIGHLAVAGPAVVVRVVSTSAALAAGRAARSCGW